MDSIGNTFSNRPLQVLRTKNYVGVSKRWYESVKRAQPKKLQGRNEAAGICKFRIIFAVTAAANFPCFALSSEHVKNKIIILIVSSLCPLIRERVLRQTYLKGRPCSFLALEGDGAAQ